MSEWVIAALGISGTLAGTALGYWLSMRSNKMEKTDRMLRTARILHADVHARLIIAEALELEIGKWIRTRKVGKKAPTWITNPPLDMFDKEMFGPLLPDLALLPHTCLARVLNYYKVVEPLYVKLVRDGLAAGTRADLVKAQRACRDVVHAGRDVYASLVSILRNVSEAEANRLVSEWVEKMKSKWRKQGGIRI